VYNTETMGHLERQRIIAAENFVRQLKNLNIPSGCFHASILAMGGSNIHLHDVVCSYENKAGIPNLDAYLHAQGLSLSLSLRLDRPLSMSQAKKMLETPKVVITDLNTCQNPNPRVVGLLFAFGEYQNEPPHVVGVLPRGDMTRNLRNILKSEDSHVVIDTSCACQPIYTMTVKNIAENLNAFILNGIDVSMHIVTKFTSWDRGRYSLM